jgi:anti-sigma factor RsiW
MNRDAQLRIQSYLDGELSAAEAREIAELLSRDPVAAALHDELSRTRTLLRTGEPVCQVAETREFYWSKIARAIECQAATGEEPPRSPWALVPTWLRWFVPVAGLAAVLALLVTSPFGGYAPFEAFSESHVDEEEEAIFGTTHFTFHSETHGLTVLWVQNRWE